VGRACAELVKQGFDPLCVERWSERGQPSKHHFCSELSTAEWPQHFSHRIANSHPCAKIKNSAPRQM
jgi:hypothetical protein